MTEHHTYPRHEYRFTVIRRAEQPVTVTADSLAQAYETLTAWALGGFHEAVETGSVRLVRIAPHDLEAKRVRS